MDLRRLVQISRPLFWPAPFVVFLGAFAVSGASFTLLALVQLCAFTVLYSFFIYGINDVYDYESDRSNPRKGGSEGAVVEPGSHDEVKQYVYLAGAVLLAISASTFNAFNLLGVSLGLVFSHQYSAPPLRLKEKPPLDSISNGFIYLLGPAMSGFSLGGSLTSFPVEAYWVTACTIGFHAYSTITDYEADREAGDATFAVKYGRRAAAITASIIFAATALLSSIETLEIRVFCGIAAILFCTTAAKPNREIAHKVFWSLFFSGAVLALMLIYSIIY